MMIQEHRLALSVFLMLQSLILIGAEEIRCKVEYWNDSRGLPYLDLSSKFIDHHGQYTECISVYVWIRPKELRKKLKIEVTAPRTRDISIKRKKEQHDIVKWTETEKIARCATTTSPPNNDSVPVWKLHYDCFKANSGETVFVSFTSKTGSGNASYNVSDPVPEFNLTVDEKSRSVYMTVQSGVEVYIRWCYIKDEGSCSDGNLPSRHFTEPSQSQPVIFKLPHLLPCLCVEVYYTHSDATRGRKCPFKNMSLRDGFHGNITQHPSSVVWSSPCPVSDLKPSASLCWSLNTKHCMLIPNATLPDLEEPRKLRYNISYVDHHPQMCIQFSVQGAHDVYCPFQSTQSKWNARISPTSRGLLVLVTSHIAATFSAQLCVLKERSCESIGQVHTVQMERDTSETQINVPLDFLPEELCVQVWQSNPVHYGRRLLCREYTHKRYGVIAVAALVSVVTVVFLGILIHHVAKKAVPGWLSIKRPVLLVCSSEHSAQVSAVCALASLLQEELCAAVHTALWAQSSGKQTGVRPGVTDLGPLPWLYGQWEAVQKADGNVLIAWSPEAKRSYEEWRQERMQTDGNKRKTGEDSKHGVRCDKIGDFNRKFKMRREGKYNKEEDTGRQGLGVLLPEEDEEEPQRDTTSVTRPVFKATLACLQGALQGGGKGHGVALVYFNGLCSSRDIPNELKGFPRYCLPQDFGALVEELGGMAVKTESDSFGRHCWLRLISKTLSLSLARRLAHRLRAQVQTTQMTKTQVPRPMLHKIISEKIPDRFKSSMPANMTMQEAMQEQEPLHKSP